LNNDIRTGWLLLGVVDDSNEAKTPRDDWSISRCSIGDSSIGNSSSGGSSSGGSDDSSSGSDDSSSNGGVCDLSLPVPAISSEIICPLIKLVSCFIATILMIIMILLLPTVQ